MVTNASAQFRIAEQNTHTHRDTQIGVINYARVFLDSKRREITKLSNNEQGIGKAYTFTDNIFIRAIIYILRFGFFLSFFYDVYRFEGRNNVICTGCPSTVAQHRLLLRNK